MDPFWHLLIGMVIGFGFGALFGRMMTLAHPPQPPKIDDPFDWE